MNNERDKHSMDDLVSAAYREHSTERAPDHLNQKILAMAADGSGETKKITPLFRAWTKPLALAASVAFSFAVVLEVTRVPQELLEPALPVAPAEDSVREEFSPKVSATVEEARNQARLRDGFNQEESLVAEPQASIELQSRQNTIVADAPAELEETESAPKAAAAAVPEPTVPSTDGISDADRPDRARRGLSRDLQQADEAVVESVARPAATAFSMSLEKKESDAKASCEAYKRAVRNDWLACIEELRHSGAVREAEREYEEFILKFPAE